MNKRIISILLAVCLCVTVLAGCESSGAATAPAEATSDNLVMQDEKILGIIGDATLSSKQEDVRALCESCGLDFEEYNSCLQSISEQEFVDETAADLIAMGGCTTIIFAVKGSEQIAEDFSLQHPEIEVVIADIARTTDATSGDLPSGATEETDIDWTEVSYTETDSDGYTYEITFKLSPWILQSNTDIVNSAWSEVGGNNALPGFDDWGFELRGGSYVRIGVPNGGSSTNFAYSNSMSDMYYCLGTVQIQNKTEGWSIRSDTARSFTYQLFWRSNYNNMSNGYAIGRTFLGNGTKDQSNGLWVNAHMEKDSWGPVPFVIMAPEIFSPNFPDGEHPEDMLNGYFYYPRSDAPSEKIHLGTIGKDGVYTPPISAE